LLEKYIINLNRDLLGCILFFRSIKNILGLITLRVSNKDLPRKNIKSSLGKPLLLGQLKRH